MASDAAPRLSGGPAPHAAPRRLGTSPFARLAQVHVLSVAGDTLVTMALAGSLFFSISPQAARGRVALYLLLTMAPFAVVAPFLGPLLDRRQGGRRIVVTLSAAGRALICLLMANHLDSWLLFPEAFAVLVLSKAYLVTKSALVPAAVTMERALVEANARLALLAAVAGFAASAPGALLLKLDALGAPWAMRLAALVFATAAVAALRLPPPAEGRRPAGEGRTAAGHTAAVLLSATAMAVLRGIVGFLTFLVAFALRRADAATWMFGAVLAASLVGSLLASVVAPRVRRRVAEETMVVGSLLVVASAALLAARAGGGYVAAAGLAGAVGLSAGTAKLAFDAIVQRDAADVVRGHAFARFETRFQLVWVLGAAIPVVVPISLRLGMIVLGVAAAFAAFSYAGGRVAAAGAGAPRGPHGPA